MRFTAALAYEPLRVDAKALAVALSWDPTPRLWKKPVSRVRRQPAAKMPELRSLLIELQPR
jgi:hypothetical protein